MHEVSDTFLVQHVSTASWVSKSDQRLTGHRNVAIKDIQKGVLLQRGKRANSDLPNTCQSVSGISYCSSLSLLSTPGQNSSMHAWHNAEFVSSWAKACETQPQCIQRRSIRVGVARGIHTPCIDQRTSLSNWHASMLLVAVQAEIQVCCGVYVLQQNRTLSFGLPGCHGPFMRCRQDFFRAVRPESFISSAQQSLERSMVLQYQQRKFRGGISC